MNDMTTQAQVRNHPQAGFTLTEVMVATMMTTALLAAGFGALTVSQKTTRISGQPPMVRAKTSANTTACAAMAPA